MQKESSLLTFKKLLGLLNVYCRTREPHYYKSLASLVILHAFLFDCSKIIFIRRTHLSAVVQKKDIRKLFIPRSSDTLLAYAI